MKRFRMGYSLLVLMLMSLFSRNVNLFADINVGKEVRMGVELTPGLLTKAGEMMKFSAEHVQKNVVTGNYLELVFGAIAVCIFLLFTMELLDEKRKKTKKLY